MSDAPIVALKTAAGFDVLHAESHALPLVDFSILWRAGALADPEGQEGLTLMLGRLIQRGRKGESTAQVDDAVAAMGARLSVSVGREVVRLGGTVLARNLEPFVMLLAGLLAEPAIRGADLAREKRRIRDDLFDLREDDGSLASRQFRAHLFGVHPYARPIGGTLKSVGKIRRADVLELHARTCRQGNLLFGAAGAVDVETLTALVDRAFFSIPKGRAASVRAKVPKAIPGRRAVVVDKKDRAQVQLGIGTLGLPRRDPRRAALVVADTAFGGLFTSRLMQEVRAARGFSYSAGSRLEAPSQRGAWSMWTHPSVENFRECAELQLGLFDDWIANGLKLREVRFAKRYLIGSRCLDVDTPSARLELALDAVYHGFPLDYPDGYTQRIRAVKPDDANAAVHVLKPKNLSIVAVGDADRLVPELESLHGIDDVQVIPHEAV